MKEDTQPAKKGGGYVLAMKFVKLLALLAVAAVALNVTACASKRPAPSTPAPSFSK